MLRLAGAEVALLDGGMAKWKAEGRPLAIGFDDAARGNFALMPPKAQARTLGEMRVTSEQIADARSLARFTGDEPDPRAEVAAGHIPGSRHVNYARFFNEDGTWKAASVYSTALTVAARRCALISVGVNGPAGSDRCPLRLTISATATATTTTASAEIAGASQRRRVGLGAPPDRTEAPSTVAIGSGTPR